MSQIADNIASIQDKITKAARERGRNARDIHLVAVSKRQSQERIAAALAAGHRLFGENKVQEAFEHWEELKGQYPDLKLHLIGPLQTNKVKEAVSLFDCIETIDREKLALELVKEMKAQRRNIPCFIQVNTGEEPQKSGVFPGDLPELLKTCRDAGLDIQGLMCIPPIDEPAAVHFAFLKKMADDNNLKELSMGMSGDFEKAIPLGATYVRVGTAVFGNRE